VASLQEAMQNLRIDAVAARADRILIAKVVFTNAQRLSSQTDVSSTWTRPALMRRANARSNARAMKYDGGEFKNMTCKTRERRMSHDGIRNNVG
jgi:hypothetical protein